MRYLLRFDVDTCSIEHRFLEDDAVPNDDDPYVIVIDDKEHHYVKDRLRLLKAIEVLADVLDPPSDVPLLYQTILTLLEGAFVLGRKYQRDNPKAKV